MDSSFPPMSFCRWFFLTLFLHLEPQKTLPRRENPTNTSATDKRCDFIDEIGIKVFFIVTKISMSHFTTF